MLPILLQGSDGQIPAGFVQWRALASLGGVVRGSTGNGARSVALFLVHGRAERVGQQYALQRIATATTW